MLIFCLRLALTCDNKETQFLCAMLVLERDWEEKSHPLHVLCQLLGGPWYLQKKKKWKAHIIISICLHISHRKKNDCGKEGKKSPQAGQAVEQQVCTQLQKLHITTTNPDDPYLCSASRWMEGQMKSSSLCSLDHIEEGHLLRLPLS